MLLRPGPDLQANAGILLYSSCVSKVPVKKDMYSDWKGPSQHIRTTTGEKNMYCLTSAKGQENVEA